MELAAAQKNPDRLYSWPAATTVASRRPCALSRAPTRARLGRCFVRSLAAFLALSPLLGLGCGRTPTGVFAGATGGNGASATVGATGDGTRSSGDTDDSHSVTSSPGDTSGTGETTDASTSTGALNCEDTPELCLVDVTLRRAVDVLFVVDNSGSMGDEQGTLSASFASFIDVLESQQVGANYRIGVATTDGSGSIRATSCRSRLPEFIFSGALGMIDERQRGCLDVCELDSIDLPDPWVEKSNGSTNLPPGVSLTEALQCIGPQGINGPGFEAPLESMRRAIVNDAPGFFRPDALLAVVFVTDEADCSATLDNHNWLRDFGSVFWSDPTAATSGACWGAGVRCAGGPGVYDDCEAVDFDRDGLETEVEDEAVLFPVDRYVDTLRDLAEQKQAAGGQGEVFVALLGGVPLGHPQTGEHFYADSALPEFNGQYGIGPGCGVGTETVLSPPGIPPVRLREFAEAFANETRNMFSICSPDYGVALADIAGSIGEISERACVGGCVADSDQDIPGLQPTCSVVEQFGDGMPDVTVQACVIDGDTWSFPSEEANACFRRLTDETGATATPLDDLSTQCTTLGAILEFVVERRNDAPVPAGTTVRVTCELAVPLGQVCV